MSNVSDLRDTIVPKSDQINAEQLLGGPLTITVTGVSRGTADQPVVVNYMDDGGRPYKPCKSMRKLIIFAWGEDGAQWVGRSMTIYNKQDVKWGGVAVGGIRISHMSHIERDIALSLTATKGKKEPYTVKRLAEPVRAASAPVSDDYESQRIDLMSVAAQQGLEAFKAAWNALTPAARKGIGSAFRDEQAARATEADARRAAPAGVDAGDDGETF